MNSTNTPSSPGGVQAASTPLSQTARETAAQVAATAREKAAQAAESASEYASGKKAAAAERVQAYGSAIHETARSLEERDPNIAWFTHQAADRLERAATYVRERDWRDLRVDTEDFARRHPGAFFGGMCVAGLILGSVIKASGRSRTEGYPEVDDESDERLRSAPVEDAAMSGAQI